jgi:hypothetical protein
MYASASGVVFIGAIAIGLVVVGLAGGSWGAGWKASLIIGLCGVFCGLLTAYVWRDMRGKRPWRIEIEPGVLSLDLPAGRSLIHNPPACKAVVPAEDIAGIETRLEVYKGLVQSMMQRPFRLVRKDGTDIFLFEERALETRLATAPLTPVATDIAASLGVTLKDLGMAKAGAGILGAWFVRAPDWSAVSLPPEEEARLLRGVRLTGAFAGLAIALVVLWIIFR